MLNQQRGAVIPATALHQASERGHWKLVQILIQKEPSLINVKVGSLTALHRAAIANHQLVVSALLKLNCDAEVDSVDKRSGRTPLMDAAQAGYDEVAEAIQLCIKCLLETPTTFFNPDVARARRRSPPKGPLRLLRV